MIFLVNEQNASVIIYIDTNAISWCLDLNIFQQDECFCSKLGLEVEHAKSNLKNINISDFRDLSLATFCQSRAEPKTLNEKTGNCTLILYKTNGQRAVLSAYYAPFPLSTWDAYSLWSYRQFGGRRQCLFCFFVNQQSHPYNAVIKPNQLIITSKARDQLQVRAHWWRDARISLSHC